MTANQLSKLKMFLSLNVYLASNEAIVAKLPNSNEFVTALNDAILQIQTKDEEHYHSNKGIADNKNKLKGELIDIILDNSRKMQAYSLYRHDEVLLAKTKTTLTKLRNQSGVELVNVARGIYHSIESRLSEVTAYNLSNDTQLKFREAIDLFSTSLPQPRESMLKSKENTFLLKQGFEVGDAAIGQLDALVEIVRMTEPTFYESYRNTRKIIPQGTGSLQVKGVVAEAVTGKPLPRAILSFCLSNQSEIVIKKKTAAKGGFRIKSLDEGIYEVTVTKVGFKTQTITVTVRWDELCVVNVKMEKIN